MLRQLLAAPEVRRLLAEHARVGQAMRPLCRALGVEEAFYLNVALPTAAELEAAPSIVPPPPPPPEPAPPMIGGIIPWYHQKWAQ